MSTIPIINKASAGNASAKPSTALPGFGRLAGAACAVGALPFALLLIMGKTSLAGSLALGGAMSLGVCGLLFLFVERLMPLMTGTARHRTGIVTAQGSQFQFLLLLGAKLIFIALVGAAFLTLRHISSVAVLIGFLLGQSAIVISAMRFRKPLEI